MNTREGLAYPVIVGGLVGGILSSIPICNMLNCFCCSLLVLGGAIAGGMLASQANKVGKYMNTGEGALAGALAGLGAGVLSALIEMGIQMIIPRAFDPSMILKNLGDNPEAQRAVRQWMKILDKPLLLFGISLVFKTIFGAMFGALGGLIGVLIVRKPQLPPAPPATTTWTVPPAEPPAPSGPVSPPPMGGSGPAGPSSSTDSHNNPFGADI